MIGLVIVSHSAKLAEGVCELAGQMSQGRVRLAAAGGTGDPANPLGTNAFEVLRAVEAVYSDDGVLVFTDLGSAVLSAETALEMLPDDRRPCVRLCAGPVVDGAVAAAAQAAAGASVDEILRDAGAKTVASAAGVERRVVLPNALGIHARPAAAMVRLARGCQARVTVENLTRPAGPVDAGAIRGLLALDARQGHQLLLRAEGPEAQLALGKLAAFVESGCGDTEAQAEQARAPAGEGTLTGLPASAGIAIGPLLRLRPAQVETGATRVEDPEPEWRRLLAAVRGAQDETRELYNRARARAGEARAGIFDAQLLFLEDPELHRAAARLVLSERYSAASAWQTVTAELAGAAGRLDVPDLAARVLRRLAGVVPQRLTKPAVVAAHDLTPSDVQALDPALALGVCLEGGGAGAHSVILARAMGIPAVAGLGPALAEIADGTTVALDGERGAVWVSPSAEQVRVLEGRRQAWLTGRHAALANRRVPARTRDGRRIRVVANLSGVAEAAEALDYGAEGVGVLRTEFLFLHRATAPDEEEQFAAYSAIARTLGDLPLVIRTLDVGGDKPLPYIGTGAEANPFLGWRGIRLTLGRPDLFAAQVRAIRRAGAEILLPMVSSLEELRAAKAIAGPGPLGIMIEVPAAVAVADRLAREAAFFSVGTNDLIQYTMAADRTNPRVASLADPFQPAVLRLLRQAVEAGRAAGIGVALCGELAADPLATPLLLGLGIDEFSVSPPLIPELKRAIAAWTMPAAGDVARRALEQESCEGVRQLLVTL